MNKAKSSNLQRNEEVEIKNQQKIQQNKNIISSCHKKIETPSDSGKNSYFSVGKKVIGHIPCRATAWPMQTAV